MFTQFMSCRSAFCTSVVQLGQLAIEGDTFWQVFFVAMDHAVDLPSHLLFSHPEITHGFDEFLKTATACAHTHTCNPPGPSAALHTHTCLHTHLQMFASPENTVEEGDPRKPRKPLGNREAVRKYREKKKAHAAFLEEEVKKLRATNRQLLKRLQGHASLQAEVVRLRGLLFDVRGKIDSEIDACNDNLQKHRVECSVKCADPFLCFNTDAAELAAPEESSEPTIVDFDVDGSGNISRNLDNPEVDDSMDVVASLVN